MSGIHQAVVSTFIATGPGEIGSSFQGGYYAGQISTTGDGIATHYLVVAPKSSGQTDNVWYPSETFINNTSSVIDGPTNSSNAASAGGNAASFCENLSIGGYSDWYLPAKNELEVCYYNLKPTTTSNDTSSGTNTNAVPSRGSNYTTTVPAQTSASIFKTGGSESFDSAKYWSSTQSSTPSAWAQYFFQGYQYVRNKTFSLRVRAVRRVAV